MLSLLDLISQNQPHFQTHQALIVIGLQNDFIDPDGRLPVDTRSGFLDRIHAVVPKFRQLSTNVIWVQTLYEADRLANDPNTGEGDAVVVGGLVDAVESSTDDDDDLSKEPEPAAPAQSRSSRRKQRALDLLKKVSARRRAAPAEVLQTAEEDEELFLLRSSKRAPACLPNSPGAELIDTAKGSIAKTDVVLRTTNYSAFLGTSLLLILRAKLVTEVYICGCITNVSVLATVIDAARHGIRINVISDCLAYRKQNRHDEALRKMVDYVDANLVTSRDILDRDPPQGSKPQSESSSKDNQDALEARVAALRLTEDAPTSSLADSLKSSSLSRSATVSGRPRNLSDASYAESRLTTDTRLSDEQFTETLVQGAQVPKREEDAAAPRNKMVKSRIRMRRRPHEKNEKEGEKKAGEESSGKSEKKSSSAEKKDAGAVKDVEKTPTQPPKSPTPTAASATKARHATVVKAESSDNLNRSPSKQDQSLKSSVSQPSLSASAEKKEMKKQPSRMRLALSRNSRSESKKDKDDRPKTPLSPAKLNEAPKMSLTKMAPEPAATSSKKADTPKYPLSPSKTTSTPNKISKALSPSSSNPSTVPTTPKLAPSQQSKPPASSKSKKPQSLATFPVLGPGDNIASGDSRIVHDFLPPTLRHHTDRSKPLIDLIFPALFNEIRWQRMLHQTGEVPRLVCCQGEFGGDGSMPVYRHPTDQVLPLMHFSPMVEVVRRRAEEAVGHPLNHALIQLYRSGNDYISEHSDKTLDIVRGSKIVNVSFGAQRTMRLRTKKASSLSKAGDETSNPTDHESSRTTQRVPLPHNSLFILGPVSNSNWLHGIPADKRIASERSDAETAYGGMRISLTFRHIGTFIDAESSSIWGQGATSKEKRNARDVVNNDESANEKIVRAFSKENHGTAEEFSWDKEYGRGFDVLHFRDAPEEEEPLFFAGGNQVETDMIRIFLAEKQIRHVLLPAPTTSSLDPAEVGEYEGNREPTYRDTDTQHTEIHGAIPILLYLDRYHALDRGESGKHGVARSYEVLGKVGKLVGAWGNMGRGIPTFEREVVDLLDGFEEALAVLRPTWGKKKNGEEMFITGRRFSVGDCAIWPLLGELIGQWEGWDGDRWRLLEGYYRGVWEGRKSVKGVRAELHELKRGKSEKSGQEKGTEGKAGDQGKGKEHAKEEEDEDEEDEDDE